MFAKLGTAANRRRVQRADICSSRQTTWAEPVCGGFGPRDGRAVRTSPAAWRRTKRLLERAGECGFGIVSDGLGDLGDGCAGVAQPLSCDLHAPIGEIMHRWHANQTNEAIGQCRTRQADLAAKIIDGPTPTDRVTEKAQLHRREFGFSSRTLRVLTSYPATERVDASGHLINGRLSY